ncbi:MAG: SNF2-related protein, partial [Gemmatimonadaceae bacterium]
MRGTVAYHVEITVGSGGAVAVLCSCPFAQEHVVCKHSWATLLEAAAHGSLPAALAHGALSNRAKAARNGARAAPTPEWERRLGQMQQSLAAAPARPTPAPWPADRRLAYIMDVPATVAANGLIVELATERQLKDGSWDRPRQYALGAERWLQAPDEDDRRIAQMLVGARTEYGYSGITASRRFQLPEAAYDTTLRLMCETGRSRLRREVGEEWPEPVLWDDGDPWRLQLAVSRATRGSGYLLDGILRRGDQTIPLAAPALLLHGGLLVAEGRVARFEHGGAFPLVSALRTDGPVSVGARELPRLLETLYALPNLPPVELPPELAIEETRPVPVPQLTVSGAPPRGTGGHGLPLTLTFRYDDTEVPATRSEPSIFDRRRRAVLHRDRDAEDRAAVLLRELGARDEYDYQARRPRLALPPQRLDAAVRELTAQGWHVEAEGRVFRQPGTSHASLRSGVDWFELEAGVAYGDQQASLPRLLAALRRGERTVVLDDGSLGILPDEWLRRYAPLAGAGDVDGGDTLRFSRSQVALLDVMLAQMPEVSTDHVFGRARDALRGFDHIAPADAPAGFTGELRSYQREGLGWLHFLRGFGFGGCLADDMGLGKTIQVLALLESRREEKAGPSLV